MRINKISQAVLLIAATLLFTVCKKPTPNTPPEPDKEVQSALDATWATYVVTDMVMMCGYLGENDYLEHPYLHLEGTPFNNQVKAVRDPSEERLSMVFNQTECTDGRLRHGEVRMTYKPDPINNPFANPNSNYFHEFGFAGELSLSDFRTDSFLITMGPKGKPERGYVINQLDTNEFNQDEVNISWEIRSKFHFQHPEDSTGASDIEWEGKIFMVLTNTADDSVFSRDREPAIIWERAVVGYYGEVTGKIGTTPFTYSIKESQMLIRDFSCAPDRVRGVKLDPQNNLEKLDLTHHPFVKGVAVFTIGDKYPRQIYFGNESNSGLAWQCDNVGEVMIKGIAYRVNFRK